MATVPKLGAQLTPQEVLNRSCDFHSMGFEREVASVAEMGRGVLVIALDRLCSKERKNGFFAPHSHNWAVIMCGSPSHTRTPISPRIRLVISYMFCFADRSTPRPSGLLSTNGHLLQF